MSDGEDTDPGDAGAALSVEMLKAVIEGDNRNHPSASVQAAREALDQLGPQGDPEQRLWFLAWVQQRFLATSVWGDFP